MHISHSEVEYQTKKKNTIHEPAGEHCVQLFGEHERGVEGRENTQERRAAGRMRGRTLKE